MLGHGFSKCTKRKQLQVYAEKRKSSVAVLLYEQQKKTVEINSEDTPEGLQQEFYNNAIYELAKRREEATSLQI